MTPLYQDLTQPELLERLSEKGIKVSTQTLRNWETAKLITPPTRGSRYGGRWAAYTEYVLIECYAAYHLLSQNARRTPGVYELKCNPTLISKARRSCHFHPKGLPARPLDESCYDWLETPDQKKRLVSCQDPMYEGEKVISRITITEGFLPSDFNLQETHDPLPLDADVTFLEPSHSLSWEDLVPLDCDLRQNTFSESLYRVTLLAAELLWFKYLCQGAALFFPEHYNGGQS